MKMEQTQCPKTPAYKLQTPGDYAEGNIKQNLLNLASSLSSIILFNYKNLQDLRLSEE